jgi:1,4-alpha-glucan branching enzyme
VSIAGDFNNWQPAPMQREGGEWIVRLPLGPGVYNYTFRSASGEWFVPPSTAGRRDDGMGGYVAVLVVN